jgi:acyl carrier protein phosphodiesterase
MNFLAHIYLSGNNDLIKIGNFVGDWIKGNEFKKYEPDIQKGILMHRFIDSYTDNHKYSGIIIDIFYDHFLAKNWQTYSPVILNDFISSLKESLHINMHHFSPEVQEFIPRFMKFGWMESYVTLEGIELVLQGMSRHTSLPDKTEDAIKILKAYYKNFENEFLEYFPQLIKRIEEDYEVELPK